MAWSLSNRVLAEFVSLFPFTLTHLERLMDARLEILQIDKQQSQCEFADRSVDNFEIDMSISFFNQIKELIHQRPFTTLVKQIKTQAKK